MQRETLLISLLMGAGVLVIIRSVFWSAHTLRSTRTGLIVRLENLLEGAGFSRKHLGALLGVSLLAGGLSAFVVGLVLPILGLLAVAFCAGSFGPMMFLLARSRKRFEQARVLWPDLLDQLIASLRSGLSLAEGLQSLGSSGSEIAEHFAVFGHDYERSHSFERALARLKIALSDPIADRVLEGIRMVREIGGHELIPMLQQLNDSLRRENRLRSELVARQSWLMNAARMGAVAPWLVLMIIASRAETAQMYNSVGGTLVILLGLVLTIVAYVLMRRIARLPEETRWLG